MPRSAIFLHHFSIISCRLFSVVPPPPSLAAVLDGCTDDTLLAIAVALPSRTDLLRFVLVSHAPASAQTQVRVLLDPC
eukprot:COSAG06_NODE_774_length_12424_cov_35.268014_17_plen_78_part_00